MANILIESCGNIPNEIKKIIGIFFGDDKQKEYMVEDLDRCIKRVTFCHVLDAVLVEGLKEYSDVYREDGKIVIGKRDPLHGVEVSSLHDMAYDAMMLSLRILFAKSNSDKTSGGAFLRTIKNLPSGIIGGLSGLRNKTIQFCDEIYKDKDGTDLNNYYMCKEYERYCFHKDQWGDDGKYSVKKTQREVCDMITIDIVNRATRYDLGSFDIHKTLNIFADIIKQFINLVNAQYGPIIRPLQPVALNSYIRNCFDIFCITVDEEQIEQILHNIALYMPVCVDIK